MPGGDDRRRKSFRRELPGLGVSRLRRPRRGNGRRPRRSRGAFGRLLPLGRVPARDGERVSGPLRLPEGAERPRAMPRDPRGARGDGAVRRRGGHVRDLPAPRRARLLRRPRLLPPPRTVPGFPRQPRGHGLRHVHEPADLAGLRRAHLLRPGSESHAREGHRRARPNLYLRNRHLWAREGVPFRDRVRQGLRGARMGPALLVAALPLGVAHRQGRRDGVRRGKRGARRDHGHAGGGEDGRERPRPGRGGAVCRGASGGRLRCGGGGVRAERRPAARARRRS